MEAHSRGRSLSSKGYNETLTTPSDHKDSLNHNMFNIHGMFGGVRRGVTQIAVAVGDLHSKFDDLSARTDKLDVQMSTVSSSINVGGSINDGGSVNAGGSINDATVEQLAKRISENSDEHLRETLTDINTMVGSTVSGAVAVLQNSITHLGVRVEHMSGNIKDQRAFMTAMSGGLTETAAAIERFAARMNLVENELLSIKNSHTEIINLLSSINVGLSAQAAKDAKLDVKVAAIIAANNAANAANSHSGYQSGLISEPLSAPVSDPVSAVVNSSGMSDSSAFASSDTGVHVSRPVSVNGDNVAVDNVAVDNVAVDNVAVDNVAVDDTIVAKSELTLPSIVNEQPLVIKKMRKRATKKKT